MDSPRTYWPKWTETLRRLGLDGFAAWLLEAGGPINILGAQALYIGQPFAPPQASDTIRALANMLEQEDEAREFAALLHGSPNTPEPMDTTRLKGQSS